MEFEFDKEMDSLLRQAARNGETAFAAANSPSQVSDLQRQHLDADELSLFVENLLSAKQRANAINHLADCPRCRNVLAEFARLDTENSTAESAAIAPVAVSVPWYKSLFAFPKIGFAMGAFALVFSGVIVFFVLQNSQQTTNSSIAQMETTSNDSALEKSAPAAQMSANTNANMAVMPSTANSNMTAAILSTNTANAASTNTLSAIPKNNLADSSSGAAANTNAATSTNSEISARQVQDLPVMSRSISNLTAVSPKKTDADAPASAAPKPAVRDNNYQNDGVTADSAKSQNEMTQNSVVQNQQSISPDTQTVRRSNIQNGRAGMLKEEAEQRADNKKAKDKSVESKTAGGKVFKFADGVWYDSAYNNQRPVNIRRGSEEYKKLDANLRSIANQIGGVVIIIWKGNAYRIQ